MEGVVCLASRSARSPLPDRECHQRERTSVAHLSCRTSLRPCCVESSSTQLGGDGGSRGPGPVWSKCGSDEDVTRVHRVGPPGRLGRSERCGFQRLQGKQTENDNAGASSRCKSSCSALHPSARARIW